MSTKITVEEEERPEFFRNAKITAAHPPCICFACGAEIKSTHDAISIQADVWTPEAAGRIVELFSDAGSHAKAPLPDYQDDAGGGRFVVVDACDKDTCRLRLSLLLERVKDGFIYLTLVKNVIAT